MGHIILTTVLSTITGWVLGFCLKTIKDYREKNNDIKKNEKLQNMALLTLLKNNLTSTYFVYNELKEIPDYVYQNFLDMLEVYEALGGDGFIHKIAKKMENWEIIKTDIM